MATPGHSLKRRIYGSMREYLLITAYLWVIFALFEIYKSVIMAQYHVDIVRRGLALINALALAKIALIARELKLDKHLRPTGKPLIYATLFNAAVFSALLACFKILEEFAVGWYHHECFEQSMTHLGGSWQGLLCLTLIFFVMLIPFCAFGELGLVLGHGRLATLFFTEHPSVTGPESS